MTFTEAIKLAKDGKEEGYTYLYQQTCQKSYYVALKYMKQEDEALDVLQDAYVKAFQNLDQLNDAEKFVGWFSRIVATKALDELKKKKPILFSQMQSDDEEMDFEELLEDERIDDRPEFAVERAETSRLVKEMIDSLSDEQRLCIIMYYVEEISVKEIAQTLGVSENTVKSRLNYGRRNIKEKVLELEKNGTKLYSMAPFLFFLYLLLQDSQTVHAAPLASGDLLRESIISVKSSTVNPVIANMSATGKTIGTLTARKAVLSVVGVLAAGAVIGSTVWMINGREEASAEIAQEEVLVQEDAEEVQSEEPVLSEETASEEDAAREAQSDSEAAVYEEQEAELQNTEEEEVSEAEEAEEPQDDQKDEWKDAYIQLAESKQSEDSLLSAMERAGVDEMSDDVERKGLGTPATRADIIEKLVHDGFVKREKKHMIPTEDGMKLITILPDTVKSPKLTADWENALTLVSKGEYSMQEFMKGIEDMVRGLVRNYHSISDEQKSMFGGGTREVLGKCPKCGDDVVKGKFGAYCKNKCGMNVSKIMGVALSDSQTKSLLEGKKMLVKGLKGKKGSYDAYIIPEGVEDYSYTKDGKEVKGAQYKVKLEFPKKKK